jgi:hypothetical protein
LSGSKKKIPHPEWMPDLIKSGEGMSSGARTQPPPAAPPVAVEDEEVEQQKAIVHVVGGGSKGSRGDASNLRKATPSGRSPAVSGPKQSNTIGEEEDREPLVRVSDDDDFGECPFRRPVDTSELPTSKDTRTDSLGTDPVRKRPVTVSNGDDPLGDLSFGRAGNELGLPPSEPLNTDSFGTRSGRISREKEEDFEDEVIASPSNGTASHIQIVPDGNPHLPSPIFHIPSLTSHLTAHIHLQDDAHSSP